MISGLKRDRGFESSTALDPQHTAASSDESKPKQPQRTGQRRGKRSCLACQTGKRSCNGERPCARCATKGIPCVEMMDRRTKAFRKHGVGSTGAVVTRIAPADPVLESAMGIQSRQYPLSIGARQSVAVAAMLAQQGSQKASDAAVYGNEDRGQQLSSPSAGAVRGQAGHAQSTRILDMHASNGKFGDPEQRGDTVVEGRQNDEREREPQEVIAAASTETPTQHTTSEEVASSSTSASSVGLGVHIADLARLAGVPARKPRVRAGIGTRSKPSAGARASAQNASAHSSGWQRGPMGPGLRVPSAGRTSVTHGRGPAVRRVRESDVMLVLQTLGRSLEEQNLLSMEEDYEHLKEAIANRPFMPIPRSVSQGTVMVQTDSFGSMRILLGRRQIPPSLAAVLGGDYNVNVFVPESIDRVLNRMLLPDGTNPGLPPAARRPGFSHDLNTHDQRVCQQLSNSPVAVARCMLDPFTLQSAGGFCNAASLRTLFGEDSMLELVVTTMSSFPLSTPIYNFVESVQQLGGFASRTGSYTHRTQYLRYEFASEQDREEVVELCSLLEQELKPAAAIRLAVKRVARRRLARGTKHGSREQGSSDRVEVASGYATDKDKVQMDGSESPLGSTATASDHGSAATEPSSGDRPHRGSEGATAENDEIDDAAIGDDRDEDASAQAAPRFVMDRILCMPFDIETRVMVEWVGSIPRATTVTMVPLAGRPPQLADFPEETAVVLGRREAAWQNGQLKAKGEADAKAHNHGASASPQVSGAASSIEFRSYDGGSYGDDSRRARASRTPIRAGTAPLQAPACNAPAVGAPKETAPSQPALQATAASRHPVLQYDSHDTSLTQPRNPIIDHHDSRTSAQLASTPLMMPGVGTATCGASSFLMSSDSSSIYTNVDDRRGPFRPASSPQGNPSNEEFKSGISFRSADQSHDFGSGTNWLDQKDIAGLSVVATHDVDQANGTLGMPRASFHSIDMTEQPVAPVLPVLSMHGSTVSAAVGAATSSQSIHSRGSGRTRAAQHVSDGSYVAGVTRHRPMQFNSSIGSGDLLAHGGARAAMNGHGRATNHHESDGAVSIGTVAWKGTVAHGNAKSMNATRSEADGTIDPKAPGAPGEADEDDDDDDDDDDDALLDIAAMHADTGPQFGTGIEGPASAGHMPSACGRSRMVDSEHAAVVGPPARSGSDRTEDEDDDDDLLMIAAMQGREGPDASHAGAYSDAGRSLGGLESSQGPGGMRLDLGENSVGTGHARGSSTTGMQHESAAADPDVVTADLALQSGTGGMCGGATCNGSVGSGVTGLSGLTSRGMDSTSSGMIAGGMHMSLHDSTSDAGTYRGKGAAGCMDGQRQRLLQEEGSLMLMRSTADRVHVTGPRVGSATTYVEAPGRGLPYNGSDRFVGEYDGSHGSLYSGTGGNFALQGATLDPGNDAHYTGASHAGAGALHAGGSSGVGGTSVRSADPSVCGSVVSSIGRPPVKRSRQGAGNKVHVTATARDMDRRQAQTDLDLRGSALHGGAVDAAPGRSGLQAADSQGGWGHGARQKQEVLALGAMNRAGPWSVEDCVEQLSPLLAEEDRINMTRRVLLLSEMETWRRSFVERLRSPGSRLGEELTRQIMRQSDGLIGQVS